jgi:hypothetical protein
LALNGAARKEIFELFPALRHAPAHEKTARRFFPRRLVQHDVAAQFQSRLALN